MSIAQAQMMGLAFLASLVSFGLVFTFIGVWRTVLSNLRESGVVRTVVAGTANWCGLMVLALGGFFFYLGEIVLESPAEVVLILPAAFVVISISLAVHARKCQEETLRALSRWNGSWVAWCLLFFLHGILESSLLPYPQRNLTSDVVMTAFVALGAAIALAFIVHGQKQWAESRRTAGWLAVLTGSIPLLLLLGIPLAELADGLSNRLILYNPLP